MEKNNTCPDVNEENRISPLSEQEIQDLSLQGEYAKPINFIKFESLEDFISSDFFKKYYDLGKKDISNNTDKYYLQKYKLDESIFTIQNLQRALIVLGFLDFTVLNGNYCSLEPDSDICAESDIPDDRLQYFGTFGPSTKSAVNIFQTQESLPLTQIVGLQTKQALYQALFYHLHYSKREVCREEHKVKRNDFKKGLQQ